MIVVALLAVLLILVYLRGTKNFNYWEKKGIKYCKPIPFFGNSFQKYFGVISPTDQLTALYRNNSGEKFVGIFEANYPALVLRDPDLIKHVLVADFIHFYPKGMNMHQNEPLMNNLFFADGDLWKVLRQKFTKGFTTGKMKAMYPILQEQAERMERIIGRASESNKEIDVRDLMARYTMDVITNCGFGIDSNSLNDDTSVYRRLGKRIFEIKHRDSLVFMLKFIATDTFKNFNFFAPEIEKSITDIVKLIFEARSDIQRADFIDILLEMKKSKTLVGQSLTKRVNGEPEKSEFVVDNMLLVAQAFILFAAGYETAAAALSFTLNQLAYNVDIQEKCREEVDSVLKKHGKITYEAVNEMKYVEMAFKEGMRMYPPIGFLIRQCAKNYTFPGTDLRIDKGVPVFIPLQALHNDETYFEQPEKFIPERFGKENSDKLNKFSYLPFGAGPRLCIGMRFGLLESVCGLATILHKYKVVPSMNSRRDLITDPTLALVQNIKGGIPLKFILRDP